jgi:cell wall-associated NlpC family hydrolase
MAQSRAGAGWLLAVAMLGSGCASTGAIPRPFPVPAGGRLTPAAEIEITDTYALVGTALDLRGVRYRNGGNDLEGFDCSGFTQYVFARHGLSLPRSVKEQFDLGRAVDADDIRQGDLLFFDIDGGGASHVAIAVGGDSFVHAPSTTGVVRVERLATRYWADRFVGARRIE